MTLKNLNISSTSYDVLSQMYIGVIYFVKCSYKRSAIALLGCV